MGNPNKYTIMWVTRFNKIEDLTMHKLREYFYNEGVIATNTKYAALKHCAISMLYDNMIEINPDFIYTIDDLMELIERHTKLRDKFETLLNALAGKKEEKTEVVGE